jgi:hypothetical protein
MLRAYCVLPRFCVISAQAILKIRPSCRRSITMPQTRTGRPVAGIPRNSPLCVPVHSKRLATLSCSAICSWMEKTRSGKPARMARIMSFRPLRPGPWPGSGTCSTTSSQANWAAASMFPCIALRHSLLPSTFKPAVWHPLPCNYQQPPRHITPATLAEGIATLPSKATVTADLVVPRISSFEG